jgi:hypothetical protein
MVEDPGAGRVIQAVLNEVSIIELFRLVLGGFPVLC